MGSGINEISDTIVGASDGTEIGNTGDALNVHVSESSTVGLTDSPNLDAFSRLRTSPATPAMYGIFSHDLLPLRFSTLTASGGTITHDSNKRTAILSTTTTTNSRAVIASKKYINYYPGISNLVLISSNLKGSATGVKKIVGQYTDDNGFFFMLFGSTLSFTIRSKISGSVVDTTVNQSSWNIDKLDGTGASGITLDLTKQQIFLFDYQWLGAGRVRVGFNLGGNIIYCHEFLHSNLLSTLYSQTATLPLRAEIINTSTTATTLELSCLVVMLEGNIPRHGVARSVSSELTAKSLASATETPVLSLRKKSTYLDADVEIASIGAFGSTTDDFLVEIYINPTLTGASWVDLSGTCQVDRSSTAISGGTVITSFYMRSGASLPTIIAQVEGALNTTIGTNLDGTSDVVTIAMTSISTIASVYASIDFRENY